MLDVTEADSVAEGDLGPENDMEEEAVPHEVKEEDGVPLDEGLTVEEKQVVGTVVSVCDLEIGGQEAVDVDVSGALRENVGETVPHDVEEVDIVPLGERLALDVETKLREAAAERVDEMETQEAETDGDCVPLSECDCETDPHNEDKSVTLVRVEGLPLAVDRTLDVTEGEAVAEREVRPEGD